MPLLREICCETVQNSPRSNVEFERQDSELQNRPCASRFASNLRVRAVRQTASIESRFEQFLALVDA